MNNFKKSMAVSILAVGISMPVYARDNSMNMQQGQSSGQGMNKGKGMNMNKGMKMDMGMSEEMKDKMARAKQQYILKVDDLSDRIRDEKDPKKKQALMDEQLQLIKDHQEKKRQMKMKMMQKHHQKMMDQKKGMNMNM